MFKRKPKVLTPQEMEEIRTKGRMTAIMLLPLETSMPTQFIHIPPIQRICATGIHLFSLPIQSIG